MIPSQSNVAPVTPQGDPTYGGSRRKVETELLIRNNVTGAYGGGEPITATFRIGVGSARLALCVAVAFQPDGAEDTPFPTSGPNAWYLQLDAWARTSRALGGFAMRANAIVERQPLPTSYEVATTGIDEWRGTVTVPNAPGSSVGAGNLYVTAMWEPSPGVNVSDDELRKLFMAGGIRSVIGGTASQTGS